MSVAAAVVQWRVPLPLLLGRENRVTSICGYAFLGKKSIRLNPKKLFTAVGNRLECLSLAGLSSLV